MKNKHSLDSLDYSGLNSQIFIQKGSAYETDIEQYLNWDEFTEMVEVLSVKGEYWNRI